MTPVERPVQGTIRPPGSKSITNRALVCAALAEGTSTLRGALDSEDTQVMLESLRRLGIAVDVADGGQTLTVVGCGGKIPAPTAELFVGNSGTTIRFLTAVCALGSGRYVLDGVPRMRQRPIGDLLAALRQLGVRCGGQEGDQFPPVWVQGGGLRGGTAHVRGEISSQFLSGLLLASPLAQSPVTLVVDGPLVSRPYVAMTRRIMEAFGAQVEAAADDQRFVVPAPQPYRATDYAIEPDASAASYFWAAAAITGGCVTVQGLSRRSLQGDVALVDCLAQMGCQVEANDDGLTVRGRAWRGIDVDMNAISDTVPTLAVVALFAQGPTTIRGVAHIRHKETDRIDDLARELRKFGAKVQTRPDGLTIVPPAALAGSSSGSSSVTPAVSSPLSSASSSPSLSPSSSSASSPPSSPALFPASSSSSVSSSVSSLVSPQGSSPVSSPVSYAAESRVPSPVSSRVWLPAYPTPQAPIETYRDHRMAMSFALAGLVCPGVVILDPQCTAKTYPAFFDDLFRLCHP